MHVDCAETMTLKKRLATATRPANSVMLGCQKDEQEEGETRMIYRFLIAGAGLALGFLGTAQPAQAQEKYISEIIMVGTNFCPQIGRAHV